MTVNLGPVAPGQPGVTPAGTGFFDYNPRCLSRDISQYISSRWSTAASTAKLIVGAADVGAFQDQIQGDTTEGLGVHTAGHMTISGDPGGVSFLPPLPSMSTQN